MNTEAEDTNNMLHDIWQKKV